ncbi:MAG: flagellar hook-basal body protein [Verrucomicrobiae bacterium]|nr:flagellar hook-basal body protein [Verrucomicrobiae bacterium]
MNVSLTQAAAGMTAVARWQEVIAQNLAGAVVPGFKRVETAFSAATHPYFPNAILPVSHVVRNFSQGHLRPTGAPTDVALDGPGFFEVQLPDGQTAFTRDGEFRVDPQGQLVTKEGHIVLGDGGPIQLDPNNGAPLSISADGTVAQGGEVRGKLRVVAFAEPHRLEWIGAGLFVARDPALVPTTAATPVRQGFLESGNTSPVTEMAHLIAALRQFEAMQRVLQSQDERLGRAIQELGNPNPV